MQARRHQYLNAMGIQVWQLRDQDPAAEPVVDVEVDSSVALEQPLELEGVLSNEIPPSASSAADNEKATVPLNTQAESVSPTSVEAEQSNPEFRLASVIFPGNCMVVTQVPIKSTEPLSGSQLSLLKNILLSIGVNLTEQPVLTFFNWPMLRSPGFDQSEAAACQACQAFLNGQKSKHSLPFVLLMGDDVGRYLLPNFECFSSTRGRLFAAANPPLLLTDAVEQLTAEPSKKASLWRDIQPLRLLLSEPSA